MRDFALDAAVGTIWYTAILFGGATILSFVSALVR